MFVVVMHHDDQGPPVTQAELRKLQNSVVKAMEKLLMRVFLLLRVGFDLNTSLLLHKSRMV